MAKRRRNDADRDQWIDNNEVLYNWWISSKLSKRNFIQLNRVMLDEAIDAILDGGK